MGQRRPASKTFRQAAHALFYLMYAGFRRHGGVFRFSARFLSAGADCRSLLGGAALPAVSAGSTARRITPAHGVYAGGADPLGSRNHAVL